MLRNKKKLLNAQEIIYPRRRHCKKINWDTVIKAVNYHLASLMELIQKSILKFVERVVWMQDVTDYWYVNFLLTFNIWYFLTRFDFTRLMLRDSFDVAIIQFRIKASAWSWF